MKTQFNAKNGNKQVSDDDTTTQIQIDPILCMLTIAVIALLIVLIF